VQGGDFEKFDGTGGRSIYSTSTFDDESFANKHGTEGVLSMANRGKHTNSSQFFVTLGNASHLDAKHVAFGRVVHGMNVVRQMATVETDEKDRPISIQRIVVVDCGTGMGKQVGKKSEDTRAAKDKKHLKHVRGGRTLSSDFSSSSSYSSSSSDDRRHHRHKSKRHKKRKRERSRSRSRERSSESKRHSRKERKKKHRHRSSSKHRKRDSDDRKHRRRSRSRSR
jgi:hypothetical protein